ncbi:MAG TPA: hypothetical protein VL137_16755 [Polyangiaceae bacterium]|nr:hypothetical protein [Polyangiaceae bacterium]
MNRLKGAALAIGLTTLGVICPRHAHAEGRPIDAFPLTAKPSIDGLLREWPTLTEFGYRGGGNGRAKGLIAYDAERLYVVMDVSDDHLVRTPNYASGEDVAKLFLNFPVRGSGRGKTHQVDLFPGNSSSIAGLVKVDGAKVTGAKLVEAPKQGGFTFEAVIPWAAFAEAATTRVGLTAALQYLDHDSAGGSATVLSTASSAQGSLPPFRLEAEYSIDQSLLNRERLGPIPSRQVVGDVAGDGWLEKVAIHGHYMVIAGWGYRGGKEFYFQDLGSDATVSRLELMDLTNDGKDDIVLQKRVTIAGLEREIFQVITIDAGKDQPYAALSQEVVLQAEGKRVENRLTFEGSGKNRKIRISQGRADNDLDPKAFEMSGGDDLKSALMPWDAVQSRAFSWNGHGFASDDEAGTPKMARPVPAGARSQNAAAKSEPADNTPPPPRPPTPDELLDRVYALYKNEHNVGNAKPRFDFVTDVAADPRPERVLVHGKDLVAFGKGFQDGASYVYLTIGVEQPSDITGATAFDITGDGKAEVIVYGVLRAKASKSMGGKTITRQVMFIYQVRESGIHRIFAAETGRSLEDNAILGRVRFLPNNKGKRIELGPGQAVGWQQNSYPFPPDRTQYGGFEPLLLPWTDMPTRRYHYDGENYVAE